MTDRLRIAVDALREARHALQDAQWDHAAANAAVRDALTPDCDAALALSLYWSAPEVRVRWISNALGIPVTAGPAAGVYAIARDLPYVRECRDCGHEDLIHFASRTSAKEFQGNKALAFCAECQAYRHEAYHRHLLANEISKCWECRWSMEDGS